MASSLLDRLEGQRSGHGDSVEVLDDSHPYSLASSMTSSSEDLLDTFSNPSVDGGIVQTAEKVMGEDSGGEEDASMDAATVSPAILPISDQSAPLDGQENTEVSVETLDIEKNDESLSDGLEKTETEANADVVVLAESHSADSPLSDPLNALGKKKKDKRVSFRSEEDAELVTDFASAPDPWRFADESTTQNVMQAYAHMCLDNNVQPLPKVLESIKRNPGGRQRSGVFDLSGETIDLALIDTLEAIFMRMSFEELNLDGCLADDELAVALMDMLEYYQMADKLVVSNNRKLQFRGWLAIAKNLKNCCLYYLDARGCILHDQFASLISRALRCGTNLVTLHLENCTLSGRPAFLLISALQFSETVQELFLGDNKLTPNDMIHLASALKHGWRIRVLDLRNNPIMNSGVAHLLDSVDDCSLRALVLYNTCITSQIGKSLAKTLFRTKTLETLNLGSNDLTDETIFAIKESLMTNRSIRRLGLQSAKISDEGCIALAEFLADHPRFLRLDIRNNEIKGGGWLALSHAAKISPSLVRVDISYDVRDMKHSETIRNSLQLIQTTCFENMDRFEKSLLPLTIEEEPVFQEEKPSEENGEALPASTEITITSPATEAAADVPHDQIADEMESTATDYPEFIGSFSQDAEPSLDIDVPRKKGSPHLARRRSSITSVTATGPLSVCDRLNEELFPVRLPAVCAPSIAPVIKGRFQISLVKATEKIYASVQSVLSPTNSQAGTPIGTAAGDAVDKATPQDGKGLFNWRATFRRGSKDMQPADLATFTDVNRSPERVEAPAVSLKNGVS